MTPKALRKNIKGLPEYPPRHLALAKALQIGAGFDGAWYRSEKEHWLGWLAEYDGPGAYGRMARASRDAKYVYNHIQCAPMLFWLAEALGMPTETLDTAYTATIQAPSKGAAQCAALRRVLPWVDIEAALASNKPKSWATKAKSLFGQ